MKKRISLKTILIIILLVAIAFFLIFAVTLKISKITYEGNEKCTDEEMEQYLFQEKMERNPFVFLFQSRFKKHKEIPFVEEYDVEMISLTEFKVTVYEKSIIGYLKYMGECMYFDKDGIVVEVSKTELEGISYVEGIDFDHIVIEEQIPVEEEDTFDTILDVTQLIDNYNIQADTIHISQDLEITLYLGKVRVELGKNDDLLSEKISDLSSISAVLEDTDGVLDMKEYSTNDKGYTFKRD